MKIILVDMTDASAPRVGACLERAGLACESLSSNTLPMADPDDISTAILVLDLRGRPVEGMDSICRLRGRFGFEPGILILADRGMLAQALEAGADHVLDGGDLFELLPAALCSLERLINRSHDRKPQTRGKHANAFFP